MSNFLSATPNIEKFGGDPENVTVMGQSAGGMSVNALLQSPLAAGLFSKAVTESDNTLNMTHDTLEAREQQYAGLFEGKTPENLRAMPVDELIAVDNSGNSCIDGYWTEDDYTLGQAMSGYLINFAKASNPNGAGLTEWTASTGSEYLNLDIPCEMKALSAEKMEIFTKILAPAAK